MIYGVLYIKDEPYPVITMYDSSGEETEDATIAFAVLIQSDEGDVTTVEILPREIRKLN
jgi:hypothetical protein